METCLEPLWLGHKDIDVYNTGDESLSLEDKLEFFPLLISGERRVQEILTNPATNSTTATIQFSLLATRFSSS